MVELIIIGHEFLFDTNTFFITSESMSNMNYKL